MRRPIDPVSDLRSTVATLQIALTSAHARIRELETIAATANTRAAEALTLADTVQMQQIMRETEARAMQPNRDISP